MNPVKIESQQTQLAALVQQALVLHRQAKLDDARKIYEQVLAQQANHFDALYLLGTLSAQLKQFALAVDLLSKASQINPQHTVCYVNRGIALQALQRFDDAVLSFDQAIKIKPDYAQAYYHRANVLQELQRLDAALSDYDQALAIDPDYFQVYYNRGNVLHQLQRREAALWNYDQAIRINSEHAEFYANRGIVLLELNRLDAALSSFDFALQLNPDTALSHAHRAAALQKLRRFEEALCSYDQAISLQAECAEHHYNRALVLHELQRLEDALLSYDQAIRIQSDYVDAHYNRAIALRELQRLDEAKSSYLQAIRIEPDFAQAHWNLALCHLLAGNFNEGWQGYEWRWREQNLTQEKRCFKQSLWLGTESLQDKTILLYAEQGLGDTLQFCRYVSCIAQLGANIILEVQRPLVRLLRQLEGVCQLVAQGDDLPDFDYQCPLCSLPLVFKADLSTIPAVPKSIIPDVDLVAKWRGLLGHSSKPRIGIVWRGNAQHGNDQKRSVDLALLIPFLSPLYDYFSLQKELSESDQNLLVQDSRIKHFGSALDDFSDTAALCELMDIVISVDTSVAHLAGTLGKPTWILLPYCPDWRWLLGRNDSPWYPSVKLYRQEKPGDWDGVLQRLYFDLQKL